VTSGGPVLVSAELECPVVSLHDAQPAPPCVFQEAWDAIAGGAWARAQFGVTRERRSAPREPCIGTAQAITTDTGPVLEVVPSPSHSLSGLAGQLEQLLALAGGVLDGLGYGLLGSAIHPSVRPRPDDYRRYRTPRPSYDYAVRERGWHHWSIVNVASVQEIVDVSFDEAPRAIRVLHRLSGLMNFVLRNDPDLLGDYDGRLSVRAKAWRDHVPPSARFPADARRVVLPEREVTSWRDYLSLLWDSSPLLLVGAKNGDAAWLPEPPTFLGFLRDAPADGWPAQTLAGAAVRVVPDAAHVAKSDWTYMGFARLRWKWRERPDGVARLVEAWGRGRPEDEVAASVEKLVVENRCNSAQPPGETLVSVALVAGLLASLEEAEELALGQPYAFWLSLLDASAREPLTARVEGRPVLELARRMLDAARRGLERRGEANPAGALGPLYGRLEERRTPAEQLLREYREGGLPALVRHARIAATGEDPLPGLLRAPASARG